MRMMWLKILFFPPPEYVGGKDTSGFFLLCKRTLVVTVFYGMRRIHEGVESYY